MSAKLSPLFNQQTITSTGAPASGWKVHTYAAGSSTDQATYTDSTGSTPQANPITLNSLGMPDSAIWLTSGLTYKFVLKDPDGVTKATIDNVAGINDTSVSTSQWTASGLTPTYVSSTSFTLQGDQTTAFHVGRRLEMTVSAGTVHGVIKTSTYSASVTTVTLLMDGSDVLDSGLSAVSLSILTATSPALPSVNNALRISGYMSTSKTFSASNTFEIIPFNTKTVDRYLEFDTATYTITLKQAGDYRIEWAGQAALGASGDWAEAAIYINGSRKATNRRSVADSTSAKTTVDVADTFYNMAVGDTIKFYAQHNSASASRTLNSTGDRELTRFSVIKL